MLRQLLDKLYYVKQRWYLTFTPLYNKLNLFIDNWLVQDLVH